VDRTNIAWPKIDMLLPIGRREVFEQFNFVSTGRFYNCERNLRARNAGDFAGQFACLMCPMREFETKDIAPENERPLEI
jgi:hypothetical protein